MLKSATRMDFALELWLCAKETAGSGIRLTSNSAIRHFIIVFSAIPAP
jgi:hypothetical protein